MVPSRKAVRNMQRHWGGVQPAFLSPLWVGAKHSISSSLSQPYFCALNLSRHSISARYVPLHGISYMKQNGVRTKQKVGTDAKSGLLAPVERGMASNVVMSEEVEDSGEEEIISDGMDKRLVISAAGLLTLFIVGTVAAVSGVVNGDSLVALAGWFEQVGPAGILLYGVLYFLLELIAVPALPLTLGSGYLFGLGQGTVVVSIASTLAATASFLIARYGLREYIINLASRYPRFRAMDRAIRKQGFKFVLLLRLSPLLPFALSNYLYGLTSVNLTAYVMASWIGMLPGTIAYVSAGAAVGALSDLGGGKGEINPLLIIIGVIGTVGALSTIGKIAGEAVEAESADEEVARY